MKRSELIKLLKKNGIVLDRHGKGHDIFINPVTKVKIIVPRHVGNEIPVGTVNNILKAAGIRKDH